MESGDRVSVFMPNCPQTIISYEAIWRAGAIAVPANPLYTAAEFAHQVDDAGSKLAIVLSLMYPRVEAAWPAVLDTLARASRLVARVQATVVGHVLTADEIETSRRLARSLGCDAFRVR